MSSNTETLLEARLVEGVPKVEVLRAAEDISGASHAELAKVLANMLASKLLKCTEELGVMSGAT